MRRDDIRSFVGFALKMFNGYKYIKETNTEGHTLNN